MNLGGTGFAASSLGGEQVLRAAIGTTRIYFGIGPASCADSMPTRMARVLDQLKPTLRALRWCQQVHGKLIASLADEPGRPSRGSACIGRCDGLISADLGLGLVVWSADCVPVILAADNVVAAVHSGWRGTAAGVVPAMVRRFELEYGVTSNELRAFIGPAVGACHYQVGLDVVRELSLQGIDKRNWLQEDRVDLRCLITGQLEAAGVAPPHILRVGPCTACDPDFASYRRDGREAGRQLSLVYQIIEARGEPL